MHQRGRIECFILITSTLYCLFCYVPFGYIMELKRGWIKMKGYTIDCDYIIKVKDYMTLPRPTRKLIDSDGTILPLISIKVDLW